MTPRTIPVTATVKTTRDIPEDVDATITTARQLERDGRDKLDRSAKMIRAVVKQLAADGWTHPEIAAALGVNRARVGQLVNPPKRATGKA
jgi:DNA-directed RNA polymerase specialized sigma24 family protein